MHDLYKFLLGWPNVGGAAAGAQQRERAAPWEAADGTGPDRLFNRYRRLRLQALVRAAPGRVSTADRSVAV